MQQLAGDYQKPFYLDKSLHKTLKGFFSSREIGLVDYIAFIPFYNKTGNLFACIIISEADSQEIINNHIIEKHDSFYSVFSEHLLYFYENIVLKTDNTKNIFKHQLFNNIKIFNEKNSYKNPFIVFFDIRHFSDIIKQSYPCLSYSGFINIIIRLFSSFILNNGKIFIAEGSLLCMVMNYPQLNDKKLLSYQIFFIIKNLLPFLTGNDDELIKVFQLPTDNNNIKDFIDADFFSI